MPVWVHCSLKGLPIIVNWKRDFVQGDASQELRILESDLTNEVQVIRLPSAQKRVQTRDPSIVADSATHEPPVSSGGRLFSTGNYSFCY